MRSNDLPPLYLSLQILVGGTICFYPSTFTSLLTAGHDVLPREHQCLLLEQAIPDLASPWFPPLFLNRTPSLQLQFPQPHSAGAS